MASVTKPLGIGILLHFLCPHLALFQMRKVTGITALKDDGFANYSEIIVVNCSRRNCDGNMLLKDSQQKAELIGKMRSRRFAVKTQNGQEVPGGGSSRMNRTQGESSDANGTAPGAGTIPTNNTDSQSEKQHHLEGTTRLDSGEGDNGTVGNLNPFNLPKYKEGNVSSFPQEQNSNINDEGNMTVSDQGSSSSSGAGRNDIDPESKVSAEAEGEPWAEGEGEPEPEPEMGEITEMSLFVTGFSLCIVFIIVGNLMVAVAIAKTPELRKSTSNLFLLSLITARASIGFLVVPARITGMFSEAYLGSVLCRLCHFAALGSSAASVFSIVAIAIVKYHQITNQALVEDMSMRRSALIISIIWVLGFLYGIRAAIVNDLIILTSHSGVRMWSCTYIPSYNNLSRYFLIVDFVCLFVIPAVIVIVCYSSVIRHLATATDNKKKRSMKVVHMLVILMVLFIICTVAPMLLNMYVLWGGGVFDGQPRTEALILLFSYSNSWFNVVVFLIFREDLRAAFVKIFCTGSRQKVEILENVSEKAQVIEKNSTDGEEGGVSNSFMMMEF